jgi:acetylornithine/succinyldiaminopimelate/putrescine aminotransferase
MTTTLDSATEVIAQEEAAQLQTYAKLPLVAVRGSGTTIYGEDGRAYLDFYSGHAVTLTGHCHPRVVAAIQQQAAELIFYSNIVYNPVRSRYADRLISVAPEGFGQVFFCNSGAEANETALKIARKFTGRTQVIAMEGAFHGRTAGALAVTANKKYSAGFGIEPLADQVTFVPWGDLEAASAAVTGETAAIILEPIQSIAGVRVADAAYYRGLRVLADQVGALLIFDEIQTGLGRTGTLWVGDYWGVTPDLITLAKGIASGVPMGATLVSSRLAATIHLEEHGSTFGGGPLACAAADATLSTILDDNLAAHAAAMERLVRDTYADLPHLQEIRGLGLLLGLRFDRPVKPIQAAALEGGLILGTSGDPTVLRLMPPLVVTAEQIAAARAILQTVLEGLDG